MRDDPDPHFIQLSAAAGCRPAVGRWPAQEIDVAHSRRASKDRSGIVSPPKAAASLGSLGRGVGGGFRRLPSPRHSPGAPGKSRPAARRGPRIPALARSLFGLVQAE